MTQQLTLTFKDCGFGNREVATLGVWVVGSVEPATFGAARAWWTFYLDARRKLIHQPARSLDEARREIEDRAWRMLIDMGAALPGDRLCVIVDGAERPAPARNLHRVRR